MIDRVAAILLISPDPRALADFYRNTLDLPLVDEEHPGVPLHYGCNVGGVHLAIHSSAGFAGVPARDAQSPIMVLGTSSVRAVAERLSASGVQTTHALLAMRGAHWYTSARPRTLVNEIP